MAEIYYQRKHSDGITYVYTASKNITNFLDEKYCYDIDDKISFGGNIHTSYENVYVDDYQNEVLGSYEVIGYYLYSRYNDEYGHYWFYTDHDDPSMKSVSSLYFPVEELTPDQFKIHIKLWVKDSSNNFYCVYDGNTYDNFTILKSADLYGYYDDSSNVIYDKNGDLDYAPSGYYNNKLYSDTIYVNCNYSWTICKSDFLIPDYLAHGTSLYVSAYITYTGNFLDKGYSYDDYWHETNETIYWTLIPESNKALLGQCLRKYILPTPSISYPQFTNSKYAKVSLPNTIINSYKAELYESIDKGSSWSLIETKTTAASMTSASSWTVTLENGQTTTATFNCAPPVANFSKSVSSNTVPKRYKVIYYSEGDKKIEKAGTIDMEILDLTMPSNPVISNYSDFNNRTPETFSIAKTTITDLTRLSFTEYFYRTSLPKTTQQGQAGVTSYQVQVLDDNNSLTTNFGNYFEIPNDSYQYRIAPKLDGSVNYKSSTNNTYEIFKYTKATSKIDMTRSIEMGTVQPKKIKILVNPIKTIFPAGSTVTFYVANNGNDENIIWEELPYDCIGSASEPKVNELEFSNNTKTADTWKVMLRIVADKGTATTDFYLKTVTVVINGGADATQNAYSVLNHVVLDANATSVQIDVPEGYNRYKLIGNIINTNKSGNPHIRVNGLTSGYDTIITYIASGTLTDTTSTVYAGFSAYTNSGKCPMFECDLFNYNTTWYISCHGDADLGDSKSHSMITLANGLQNITLTCSSNSYPMQAGTEFTLMGVET